MTPPNPRRHPMTKRPEPIPCAVWGKRLMLDGAERQLETLIWTVVMVRVLRDMLCERFEPGSGERYRAEVMAEIEAAPYSEGEAQ